ncbi:thymidylate kinase [Tilletiopsis washingtonensis]|uniref:Thymidylate kinase n=1 Tax=Tilletiopsis washingtonensis TaxID=58919 RepID=A0A316Z431_9BASI|nr:thymidylate kinase [Tilletiopsis washingtonensis]PWN95672.1 thymidylate kinase [Tilletiopsis washingtonensis]
MKRGALLVIEGLDRAGKTTQVERLVQELDARLVKFPDRTTPIGRMLDSYLQQKSELDDRAVHLLFSANRWELAPSIKADLEAGQTVVCDRYAFSGIAYSVAKGLPFDWCLSSDASLPAPDLTLFLTLSPSVAAQRGGYGDERYEEPGMQTRVRAAFEEIEARVRDWRSIDAERTEEEVWRDVSEAAEAAVRHAHGPVRPLFS